MGGCLSRGSSVSSYSSDDSPIRIHTPTTPESFDSIAAMKSATETYLHSADSYRRMGKDRHEYFAKANRFYIDDKLDKAERHEKDPTYKGTCHADRRVDRKFQNHTTKMMKKSASNDIEDKKFEEKATDSILRELEKKRKMHEAQNKAGAAKLDEKQTEVIVKKLEKFKHESELRHKKSVKEELRRNHKRTKSFSKLRPHINGYETDNLRESRKDMAKSIKIAEKNTIKEATRGERGEPIRTGAQLEKLMNNGKTIDMYPSDDEIEQMTGAARAKRADIRKGKQPADAVLKALK